jgi:glycosyltransferase involved in cell wall biosynthesis
MKVVRIIARLNVGGPARHVVWLDEGLRRAGAEVILVAGTVPPGEGDMSYFARAHGVEPVIIPEMSREISAKDVVTVWKLYRLFVHARPDIVHTHTAKAGTVGRVAGLLYRWLVPRAIIGRPRPCRFVHTYHGHIFHSYYGKLRTHLFLIIERTLARIATDCIVAISPAQFREIHETFSVGCNEQFKVIPLGLDLDVFATWPEHGKRLRYEWQEGDERCVLVGIVGRLTEIKNHRMFLQSIAAYKRRACDMDKEKPQVRFVVIGDGHLRGELETQARALGVQDDVIFAGLRDDPEEFYPALDLVALTSHNEGTPLTLIEAMANARPVVATRVGGVIDLLGEELSSDNGGWKICERGMAVQPNDAESFAEALEFLIEREIVRRETATRGRMFVETAYSKQRLVADIKNLYDELLAGAKANAST